MTQYPQGRRPIRIALKFCGSCNPEIDLSSLAGQVRKLTSSREDIQFFPFNTKELDLLVILCGCRRSCADKEEYKSQAKRHLIIAGESLDGSPQSENQLAVLIAGEIGRPDG
ncbi:MAG: hypothetical protein NTV42_02195 [Chloroflexi bacterium]|nr:hypothetical protein [Chloroflexota bacterium]